MTSQARIDANRQNAQKSTGPRTAEGKARSRQNGLTHGLTATVCTTPEDQAKIDARLADWSEALRPRDSVEAYLVGRAVAASVRLDRCGEVAASATHAEAVIDEDDDAHRVAAARLGGKLGPHARENAVVRAKLRGSVAGLAWLIARWGDVLATAEAMGHLTGKHLDLAHRLLGSGPGDDAPPAEAHRLRELERALQPSWSVSNGYQNPTPAQRAAHEPARAEHLPRLRGFVAEQIAELEQERQSRLDHPRPAPAPEGPPPADRLHRYESAAEMALHRSLNQLARLQRRPDDEANPTPRAFEPAVEANPTPADAPAPAPRDEANPTPTNPPAPESADEANPTPAAIAPEPGDEANPTILPAATSSPARNGGPVDPFTPPTAPPPDGANPTGPAAG